MIIYTDNLLAIPLLVLIWAIELYLFCLALRYLIQQIPRLRDSPLSLSLQQLTNPLPSFISDRLRRRHDKPIPAWLPWLIVFVAALIIRQALLSLVLSIIENPSV